MIPLLVEYSEDDDTGCGFGAALILGAITAVLLAVHQAVTRHRN